MTRFAQAALATVAPFVVIVGVFAGVLAHHLREPARAAARFEGGLAPTGVPTASVDDDDSVALTRTSCHGPCPAYRVSIDGAGHVRFVGHSDVCEARPAPVVIDRASAQRLIGGLHAAGFDALPRFLGHPSGVSATILELKVGDDARRVVDDGAAPGDAPLVEAAASAIDRIAGTARWLPQPRDGARPSCDRVAPPAAASAPPPAPVSAASARADP